MRSIGTLIAGLSLLTAPAAAQVWLPMGSGMDGDVNALTVYDGDLIAGGSFSMAGGVSAGGIASWDGSAWSSLGAATDGSVQALAEFDGDLIAGGEFAMAGGVSASGIARWDGAAWSPLGSGLSRSGGQAGVYSLTVHDGRLIAGGLFDTAGGATANNIAAWDGSAWAPLGDGFAGIAFVFAMTVFEGDLIARVADISAGETRVMRWDGASWTQMGDPLGDYGVSDALAVYNGQLVAGDPLFGVWLWDGAAWLYMSPSGPGGSASTIRGLVHVMLEHDDGGFTSELFIAGSFDELRVPSGPGSTRIVPVNTIVAWRGDQLFRDLDDGVGAGGAIGVMALTVYNGELIAGGRFETAGASNAANIARLGRPDAPSCYADCDDSGNLDIFDFLCFQDAFVAGCP